VKELKLYIFFKDKFFYLLYKRNNACEDHIFKSALTAV